MMRGKLLVVPIFVLTLILHGCVSGPASTVESTVAIAAGGEIADELASSVLDRADLTITKAIAEAEMAGNALLMNAADQANMVAWNIRTQLGQELDKQVSAISEEHRKLLISIDAMTTNISKFEGRATEIADTLALDLRDIMSGIPMVNQRLVMQRVTGLTHLQGKIHNDIELTGSFIGLPGESHKSEIKLFLDGKRVEINSSPKALHHRVIEIDKEVLSDFYSSTEVTFVNTELQVNQQFKKCFIGNINCKWKEKSYTVPLHLVLYPKNAGTLNYTWSRDVYGWKNGATKSNSKSGGNNSCTKNCKGWRGSPYDVFVTVNGGEKALSELQVPGDEKITSITQCSCISGTCGYDELRGHGVNDTRTRATCSWQGRSLPSTWQLTVTTQVWDKIDRATFIGNVSLSHGEISTIDIPPHTTSIKLSGQLLLGDAFEIFVSEPRNNGIVDVVKIESLANGRKRVHLRPVKPT